MSGLGMQTEHENLSPSVNVVHPTGKEVISPLGKEENDSEMNKHEKRHVQSVQNSCFPLFVTFFLLWLREHEHNIFFFCNQKRR